MIFNSSSSEIIEVLHMLMGYLPGTIHTRDIGKCKVCGKTTSSGQLEYCPKCAFVRADKLVKGLEKELQEIIEENNRWFRELYSAIGIDLDDMLRKPSIENELITTAKNHTKI